MKYYMGLRGSDDRNRRFSPAKNRTKNEKEEG